MVFLGVIDGVTEPFLFYLEGKMIEFDEMPMNDPLVFLFFLEIYRRSTWLDFEDLQFRGWELSLGMDWIGYIQAIFNIIILHININFGAW